MRLNPPASAARILGSLDSAKMCLWDCRKENLKVEQLSRAGNQVSAYPENWALWLHIAGQKVHVRWGKWQNKTMQTIFNPTKKQN